MAGNTYDCIVIGIGGIGSAALYQLARRGANVLGIDQYPVAHDKGSSHGQTRAIRLVYFEHPDYVPLLKRAYRLWDELDQATTGTLFHQTGILQAGPLNGEVLSGLLAAAEAHNLPMETLTPADVARRFPGFAIDHKDSAIYDPSGGILHVEDCIKAQVHLAEKHGATTHLHETVHRWQVSGSGVTVQTNLGQYAAHKLVIAAGPWASTLLPDFSPHLQLRRKSLFWFEADNDDYTLAGGCPVFLFEQGEHTFYGFPALDGQGIKVADHAGGEPLKSPEDLDRNVRAEELHAVSLMLSQNLPESGRQLKHHTTCIYTMSPDGHFIVGSYPGLPQVSIVAGLSGHGFKFASVLGEIMADLSLEGSTSLPIDFLSPQRLFRTR